MKKEEKEKNDFIPKNDFEKMIVKRANNYLTYKSKTGRLAIKKRDLVLEAYIHGFLAGSGNQKDFYKRNEYF